MIDKVGCQYYGFVKAAQRMSLLHFSINIKLFNYEQKVFYFLCASLLLASAFTTANAADLTGVNNGADAFMVSKLDKAALSGLYQLRVTSTAAGNTTNGVLAIENGKYVVKASNYNLLNSLWCITITEQGQGKEPIYDFVNKATGEFLAINEADVQGLAVNATSGALQVGETYGGWAFARTYKEVLEKINRCLLIKRLTMFLSCWKIMVC